MREKRDVHAIELGDELGPWEYEVNKEMIRRMTEVLDEPDLWYWEDSPFGGPIAPATISADDYIRVLETRFMHRGAVHTKAEHEFINPVRPGKRYTVRGKVADRYQKKGRDYVIIESVTTDQDGVDIVRSRNILLLSLKARTEQ
ncbi:MAG: MaoC family dehydratase N-terminal domain-containing protein [Dehalococcoidia bacterium]|jgi:acyl dehydratase|nr:MaoC family dehydratase N-terminal domain-containing protein [Dehalococcoidia bacterium]MDP7469367.1 MaoC family dehydratase N-terminal domain-containing protein [Dehalococcoidia bacterium]